MNEILRVNDKRHELQLWGGYRPSIDTIVNASTDLRLGLPPHGPGYSTDDHDGLFAWRLTNLAEHYLLKRRRGRDYNPDIAYETYILKPSDDPDAAFGFLFEGEPADTDYRLALHIAPMADPHPDPDERWRKREFRYCSAFANGLAYGRRMGMHIPHKPTGGRQRTRFADIPLSRLLNTLRENKALVTNHLNKQIKHPYAWSDGKTYQ
ncbi:MAG: hypothetical protein ACE37H_11960 [Phycisphaeraceae bacterium]